MATKKKPGKGKQTKLPGTGRTTEDVHPDIEEAATKYVEVRDERMELTKREVKAQAALLAAMKHHKLTKYRCDGEELDVEIVAKDEKVKVKRVEGAGDDDLDDEFANDGNAEPAL